MVQQFTAIVRSVQLKNRQKFIMSTINTELKFLMFILNSEFYYEFHDEMSDKCHDQYSGHSKNHNRNSMIQY